MPKQAMIPAEVDESGRVSIPHHHVPTLTRAESKEAYGTNVHSLQMMEMLVLSGHMDMKQIMDTLKELAKYQFRPASSRKAVEDEKSMEDWLKEVSNGSSQ